MNEPKEAVLSAVQATPAATAVVMWVTGKDVNFWVGVGGLIFIILQTAHLIWKWHWQRELKRRNLELDPDHE